MQPCTTPSQIRCRAFRSGDELAFRTLNEDWITEYFGLEDKDRDTLNHPREKILNCGGHIFVAELNAEVVGCCALLAMENRTFEVAKMAVDKKLRGSGIGRRLLAYVIEQATVLGAAFLYLETNDTLAGALALYRSFGFRDVAPERLVPSPYKRANVFMELALPVNRT